MCYDQRCNCYVTECRCCGCAAFGDWASYSLVAPDEDQLTMEKRPCCRRRGSCL